MDKLLKQIALQLLLEKTVKDGKGRRKRNRSGAALKRRKQAEM